jgi:hypothetical protein
MVVVENGRESDWLVEVREISSADRIMVLPSVVTESGGSEDPIVGGIRNRVATVPFETVTFGYWKTVVFPEAVTFIVRVNSPV